jgi:hypothetical protein
MLLYIVCAIALGVITEALAYALSLWWYQKAWLRIPNVLVMFGLVYGGLASVLAAQGFLVQFLAGATIGVAYEVANDRWLKLWYFPGDPWTFLSGQKAVLGVGLAWGAVPLIITLMVRVFA